MQASLFELRPCRGWRNGVLALTLVAVAASASWVAGAVARGRHDHALWAMPLILLAAWAAGSWRTPGGVLRQEGGQWWFEPAAGAAAVPAGPGALVVALDVGRWMLLRWRPAGRRRGCWLALSRRDMPGAWRAFRRAVYSARPTPAGRSAQASADPPA